MSTNNRVENIYVDLDVLLDTRMGVIATLGDDVAVQVLSNGYHARDEDTFEGVDAALYRELYKKRDVTTLKRSVVTNAVLLVKQLVSTLKEQAIVRPFHDGANVVVNTFPYQLSDEEKGEIGLAVSAWIDNKATVAVVHIRPEDLTPQLCKQEYSAMLKYEFEEWMNVQADAFRHTQIPRVTLFAPALYAAGTKPTPMELVKIIKEAAHPFRALEQLASPLIELRLTEVSYFSVVSTK